MRVTLKAPVTKRCPYRDERDDGTVTATFEVESGDIPDLHDLASVLHSYAVVRLSHEAFTADVLDRWSPHGCVAVTSTWHTAGMEVTVDVPGDQL